MIAWPFAHHFLGRGSLRVRCEAASHDHALHAAADALSPDWPHRAAGAGLCRGRDRCRRPPARRIADRHRAFPSGAASPHRCSSRARLAGRRHRHTVAGDAAVFQRILSPLAGPQHGLFLRLFRICAHITCRLLQWAGRLEAERDKTIKAAGVQRYRIWRMYMPAMAYGFDRGWLSVYQVLAQKPCGWIATAAVDALLPVFASRTRTAHRGPGLGRSLTCCNEDAGRLPGTP
jgi:hypothetical protein